MDINEGKKRFQSWEEADRVAKRMRNKHGEKYTIYRDGDAWLIGGDSKKSVKSSRKTRSFSDIRQLMYQFRLSDADTSVDEYVDEIEQGHSTKESVDQGYGENWILERADELPGCDIGMAVTNKNLYLQLTLKKGDSQRVNIKMGGAFSRHIPLVKRQAESLLNKPVVWYTWNNGRSNWGEFEWFYRIELSDD